MAISYYDDSISDTGQSSEAGEAGSSSGSRLSSSRTAVIAMADVLARRAMPALIATLVLTIVTGLFHLASAHSAASMLRAVLWMLMVLPPAWITIDRLRRYRSGGHLAGRPLTWRAGHNAGLAIISMALGCGSIFFTADPVPPVTAAASIMAMSGMALALSIAHSVHIRANFAAILPALVLSVIAVGMQAEKLSASLPALIIIAFSGIAVLAGGVFSARQHRRDVAMLLDHHPRHDVMAISARQKRKSRAYNPFKAEREKTAAAEPRRPFLYRPSEE